MKILIALIVTVLLVGGTMYFLKQRSTTPKGETNPEFSDEEYDQHYEAKEAALERLLGPMHNLVGHALIPFQVGGAVDMYYFPNGIPGTGFATMELIEPDGTGPKPNQIGTYELVSFTKLPIPTDEEKNVDHPFNKIERRMCGVLTTVGFYSYEAILNPGETCEVPSGDNEPNRCLIFDDYSPSGKLFDIDGKRHCLLLCIEVFRSEMEYAMENGSAIVLNKLKQNGYYPYSDLDRKAVY